MARQVNVALIGSKFMGRTHSDAYSNVARYFTDLPAEPVRHTIAARHAEELEPFAARWNWANWTTDWEQAVRDPDVELVDVGTPNDVHREQAIAALEAGKHVACEKPLAGTLEDAKQMKEAAAKVAPGAGGNQHTFVWYNYRRCPAVALAHRFVKEGRLGRIFHVRAAYLQSWATDPNIPRVWRFQGDVAGSGAHGDLNAHVIDMARFITGEAITEVTGAIEETFIKQRPMPDGSGKGDVGVDDAVLFLARLAGGGAASFEATRFSTGDKNRNRIEVHGEKGALRFDFERMNELKWYDATLDRPGQGWATINVTRADSGDPYAEAYWPAGGHIIGYVDTFMNMTADIMKVLGGEQPTAPLPDFADAYETQKVLHAALVAARERGPVKLSDVG